MAKVPFHTLDHAFPAGAKTASTTSKRFKRRKFEKYPFSHEADHFLSFLASHLFHVVM